MFRGVGVWGFEVRVQGLQFRDSFNGLVLGFGQKGLMAFRLVLLLRAW